MSRYFIYDSKYQPQSQKEECILNQNMSISPFTGGFQLRTVEMCDFEQFIVQARNQVCWSKLFEVYENEKLNSRNSTSSSRLQTQILQSKAVQHLEITVSLSKDTVQTKSLVAKRKRKPQNDEQMCENTQVRKRRKKEIIVTSDTLDWDSMKKMNQVWEPIGSKTNQKPQKSEQQQVFQSLLKANTENRLVSQTELVETADRQNQDQRKKQSKGQSNSKKHERSSASEFEEGSFASQDRTDVSLRGTEDEELAEAMYLYERQSSEKGSENMIFRQQRNLQGIEGEKEEIDEEEAARRRAWLENYRFIKQRSVNKNMLYVSGRAQAIIPPIQLIEEVRKQWVLQDLNSLLEYKASPEMDSLQNFLDESFGVRKPQEAFRIFKINDFSLEKAMDYCGTHYNFLKNYYSALDTQANKLLSRRKNDRKRYLISS